MSAEIHRREPEGEDESYDGVGVFYSEGVGVARFSAYTAPGADGAATAEIPVIAGPSCLTTVNWQT